MQISAAHIGTVIRLNDCPQLVRIVVVTSEQIIYQTETGHLQSTNLFDISGSIVDDRARIEDFEFNYRLGCSLIATELCAVYKILSSQLNNTVYEKAVSDLRTVRSEQAFLEEQVVKRNLLEAANETRQTMILQTA